MPALYSHTTRTTGTILTSTIYNSDHQNHIDNGIPAQLDDYSVSVGQMQTNTDPGEVGTESQATSLAGEIERLRFAIKEIKDSINGSSVAQWYTTAASGKYYRGTAVLVAGTVTVSNTNVTANSIIELTGQNSSGTHGELTISARTAGTSFTISSSSGTDTRTVGWLMFEP